MNKKEIPYSDLLNVAYDVAIKGNIIKLKADGNSMYPYIRKGSLLIISHVDFDKVAKGDVVVFKGQDKFIAHRLIKVQYVNKQRQLTTKGDSCNNADTAFGKDLYIGKVIAVEKNGKTIDMTTWMQKKTGLFLAIVSPYTPIVYNSIRFLKKMFIKKSLKKTYDNTSKK